MCFLCGEHLPNEYMNAEGRLVVVCKNLNSNLSRAIDLAGFGPIFEADS